MFTSAITSIPCNDYGHLYLFIFRDSRYRAKSGITPIARVSFGFSLCFAFASHSSTQRVSSFPTTFTYTIQSRSGPQLCQLKFSSRKIPMYLLRTLQIGRPLTLSVRKIANLDERNPFALHRQVHSVCLLHPMALFPRHSRTLVRHGNSTLCLLTILISLILHPFPEERNRYILPACESDLEFVRHSEVSSMGIVSQHSMRDSIGSSAFSGTSPTSSTGTSPKPIQRWQMKSLQQTFEDMNNNSNEKGDVEAALRRLEGQINPKVLQENSEKVNGWVRNLQERMAVGSYERRLRTSSMKSTRFRPSRIRNHEQ